MAEFHNQDEGGPSFRVVGMEDPHINFEFLIDSFSFSISLRMVDRTSKDFETKDSCNFLEDL